ncbi:hypothetical protein MMC17_004429 [Xylographa soralifera]|nr:hypothetical protein [Xylographa soralifera]
MAASKEMNPVSTPRALEAFTLPNPENPGRPRLMLRIRPHLAVPEEEGSSLSADEPAIPCKTVVKVESAGPTPPRTPGKSKGTKITLCLQRLRTKEFMEYRLGLALLCGFLKYNLPIQREELQRGQSSHEGKAGGQMSRVGN